MNSNPKKRILIGILIPLVLIAMPIVSILGHGDKHDHDDQENEEAPDTLIADTADSVQDSLNAIINEKYQTVRHIFKYSCFDCHSDSTKNPWYHFIPGIKGMMDDDVKDAKKHLDLSNDFPFGGHGTQLENLNEIKKQIEDGEMPLVSYRMMHWGRLIENERRDSVFQWIDESIELLKSHQ